MQEPSKYQSRGTFKLLAHTLEALLSDHRVISFNIMIQRNNEGSYCKWKKHYNGQLQPPIIYDQCHQHMHFQKFSQIPHVYTKYEGWLGKSININ